MTISTGLLTLPPFSHDELRGFPHAPRDRQSTLWSGAFPAVFDRRIPVSEWFSAYLATYVNRDVRQVLNVPAEHAPAARLRRRHRPEVEGRGCRAVEPGGRYRVVTRRPLEGGAGPPLRVEGNQLDPS